MNAQPKWPQLGKPVFAGDNTRLAQQMSAQTRDGRVPTFAEVYARSESQHQQDER
jgi:hypothetical protein